MRKGRVASLLLIVFSFLTGCITPRMGYPVKTVGIPTDVTLFSTISKKAEIIKKMDFLGKELWGLVYNKRFEDVLSKVPIDKLQFFMNELFLDRVNKTPDMFTPSSTQVMNAAIELSKTKEDPPTYSGYDFSQYKDKIPTKYILALTIDSWGYTASPKSSNSDENGPFMNLTIQLIDKETNESLWKYTGKYYEYVSYDSWDLTQPSFYEERYEVLLTNALNQYFSWLNFK